MRVAVGGPKLGTKGSAGAKREKTSLQTSLSDWVKTRWTIAVRLRDAAAWTERATSRRRSASLIRWSHSCFDRAASATASLNPSERAIAARSRPRSALASDDDRECWPSSCSWLEARLCSRVQTSSGDSRGPGVMVRSSVANLVSSSATACCSRSSASVSASSLAAFSAPVCNSCPLSIESANASSRS